MKETIPVKNTQRSRDFYTSIDRCAFNRRRFLIGAGALSGLAITGQFPSYAATQAPKFTTDPFSLGVASGDPLPDGVVLWTRLAPDPTGGGGMPDRTVFVEWQVARDARFKKIVRRGVAPARSTYGHSVHVDVRGLRPDTTYWFR